MKVYLDSYLVIAENAGVDLSAIHGKPISIRFEDLSSQPGQSGLLGLAYGMDDDSQVNIAIDYNNWQNMNDLERTTVMYHELSHDILNAKHVDVESHLMHPSYVFETTPQIVVAMTRIFKQFKDYTNGKTN